MRHHTGSGRRNMGLDTPAWNAAGREVVDRTLPGRVTVSPPGGDPAWDRATRSTVTQPTDPVYDGPSEVTADPPADPVDAAGQQAPERTYTVRISRSVPGAEDTHAGHIVRVLADPDPGLVEARLHVRSVRYGSRDFTRHLTCTLIK